MQRKGLAKNMDPLGNLFKKDSTQHKKLGDVNKRKEETCAVLRSERRNVRSALLWREGREFMS